MLFRSGRKIHSEVNFYATYLWALACLFQAWRVVLTLAVLSSFAIRPARITSAG